MQVSLRFFFYIALTVNNLSAQEIDTLQTLSYFPVHIGDKWQYRIREYQFEYPPERIYYRTVEVLGDTIMPNGKTYFQMSGFGELFDKTKTSHIRIDSLNLEVLHYDPETAQQDSSCKNDEISYFQLGLPSAGVTDFFCLKDIYSEYGETLGYAGCIGDSLQIKIFVFGPGGVGVGYRLAPGLGIANWSTGEGNAGAEACLHAAIINGEKFGDFVVSVNEPRRTLSHFELEQNFPNPFNASTTIKYAIEKPGFVQLLFYNAEGRKILNGIEEFKSAGQYVYHFQADDLPSGVYFYRLTVDGFPSDFRKLLFLK